MALSNQAYVIDAVRTAVGKRNGSLAGVHPVDLGALGWRGLLDRVDIDPAAVDDVITIHARAVFHPVSCAPLLTFRGSRLALNSECEAKGILFNSVCLP